MADETNKVTRHNKIPESLQASEIRYRRLFESARDGILILDADRRTITDVNPFMLELLGYSRDEFVGKELWEIGLFKDKVESQTAFQELQESGYIRYDNMPLETKSGERREVEFISSVYRESNHQVIQCNIRDNSAHKQTGEALIASETKQGQLALRQSAILDALPAHICLLCGRGNILEVNASWRQFALMNHYGEADFDVGINYIEVCERATGDCSAEAKQTAEGIKAVLSGKLKNFELEYPCHSPEERRWFRLTVTPLHEDASFGVVVMHVNVTERKLIEQALRQSEAQFRTIIDVSPVPYAINDDQQNITFLNAEFIQTFGYTLEDIPTLADWWLKAYPDPEYRRWVASTWYSHLEKAKQAGAKFEPIELNIQCKNGHVRNVIVSAAVLSESFEGIHLVMLYDITDRKKAQDALHRAEAKYRGIVESLPAIIYLAQPLPPYAPIYISPNIATFGYPPDQWYSQPDMWVKLLHEEDCQRVVQATESAMSQGLETDIEYRIVAQDGAIRWIHDKGRFITNEQGERISWQGVMLDITKTKELEEHLGQSQRLESVGRLAGGIAHDFNNLLTVINGYSEMILRRMKTVDPLHPSLEAIRSAGQRAAALTHQLLAFSRQQILQPVVLDLNEVITDTIKMLQRLIGEDVQLVTALNSKSGRVKVDPGQLSQIIINLAVNARDAMPQGGKLTIETTNVLLDLDYAKQHIAVIPGEYVMLAVSDTGIGMSDKTQQHIFEPFFTTKEVGKGTGLGLATVYGIVKQSGGNIWVYSEEGIGTTFKVYLPRVVEQAEAAETEDAPDELPKGTETILVVEDEDIVRQLTREMLEACGYTVLEARNGVEGLSIGEKHNYANQ